MYLLYMTLRSLLSLLYLQTNIHCFIFLRMVAHLKQNIIVFFKKDKSAENLKTWGRHPNSQKLVKTNTVPTLNYYFKIYSLESWINFE